MEKTLAQIIEECKSGQSPTIDELRYAVCALESLGVFDSIALARLAEVKRENKRAILTGDPEYQHKQSWDRWHKALNKSPKEWLGPNNDPDSSEYQKSREISKKLFNKIQKEIENKNVS